MLFLPPFAELDAYVARTGGTSLLVMQSGRVVHESYPNGGGATTRQSLASGSKSFWGVLATRLQQDGTLKLDGKVADVLTEWKGDSRLARMTVSQLLHLVGGIPSGERMDFKDTLQLRSVAEPGTRFAYGPTPFQSFGTYLWRLTKTEPTELLQKRVLDPLGVTVAWGFLGRRDPLLAGGARMTARDWLTFGKMVLDDAPLRKTLGTATEVNEAYGLTWWLPVPSSSQDLTTRRGLGGLGTADLLPKGTLIAAGAGKQRLFVIPAWDVVAVRTGPVSGSSYEDVPFARLLRSAVGRSPKSD